MPKISILMYLQVGPFDSPATHRSTFFHVRQFKTQMAFLSRFGYKVISLQDALDGLFGGQRLTDHSVVLTFDAGYRNFKDYAFPVLRHYEFRPAFFWWRACSTTAQSGWRTMDAMPRNCLTGRPSGNCSPTRSASDRIP